MAAQTAAGGAAGTAAKFIPWAPRPAPVLRFFRRRYHIYHMMHHPNAHTEVEDRGAATYRRARTVRRHSDEEEVV